MQVVAEDKLVESVLDPRIPFAIYFCVRELDHRSFSITHEYPSPYHLLYMVESGSLRCRVGDQGLALDAGECLWVQAGVPFRLRGSDILTISVCRFHLQDSDPLRLDADFVVAPTHQKGNLLAPLLPMYSMGRPLEGLRQRAEIAGILCHLLHRQNQQGAPQQGLNTNIQRIAIEFIHQHIRDRFSVADLADAVKMNADYFARQFKITFGKSPKAWIIDTRIKETANHLLASEATISEIADLFGFTNVFFFSRQFSKVMGVSPRQWRKQGGQY